MARRSHSRRRQLGALTADQTGNLLIGAGAVVGLGTLAYYLLREDSVVTVAPKWVTPSIQSGIDRAAAIVSTVNPAVYSAPAITTYVPPSGPVSQGGGTGLPSFSAREY